MASKALIQALAAGVFLLTPVFAQEALAEVDLWSTNECGGDPNDLSVLSFTIEAYHKDNDVNNPSSSCNSAWINLDGWPGEDSGLYQTWLDTASLDSDCTMYFYHLFDSNEQLNDDQACQYPYRRVDTKGPGCASLDLTRRFGYGICCGEGNSCPFDTNAWKRSNDSSSESAISVESEPRDEPQVSSTRSVNHGDVASIKRAPLLERLYERDTCTFVLDGEEAFTTYGKARQVSPIMDCELDQTTCGKMWNVEVGLEVSDTYTTELNAGVELFEAISFGVSSGYEHTETVSQGFSRTTSIAPQGGHKGYGIFVPLYKCAKGHFEGDCSNVDTSIVGDDGTACAIKMLPGNEPDGIVDIVTTF